MTSAVTVQALTTYRPAGNLFTLTLLTIVTLAFGLIGEVTADRTPVSTDAYQIETTAGEIPASTPIHKA